MVKHFVDIMQCSRHSVFTSIPQIHQVTGFIFQVYICDICCSENNIFIPFSEDHPSAIPADCTVHEKIIGFIKLLTTRAVVFFGGLNPACGGINIYKNIIDDRFKYFSYSY
jgi:hypothetical protein